MLAPIALFVYNRPCHTRQTVEALLQNSLASSSELFVFADGLKKSTFGEEIEKIRETREFIHQIKGFKSINIIESNHNIGLAKSVIEGVTDVIIKYGKVIVIEDDILTHPDFLTFMNDGLNTYKNTEELFMISGFSYNIKIPNSYQNKVYFTHRCCSWGWATWLDRWEKANWILDDDMDIFLSKKLQHSFNKPGRDLYNMLTLQKKGIIDSWAIRWGYNMFCNKAYCMNPIHSLVKNIGFDGSGTHKDYIISDNYVADFPQERFTLDSFPCCIKKEMVLDKQIRSFLDGNTSLYQKIRYSIRKRVKQISKQQV